MNRGSGSYPSKGIEMTWGFNEAPIHESGKFREVDIDLIAGPKLQ